MAMRRLSVCTSPCHGPPLAVHHEAEEGVRKKQKVLQVPESDRRWPRVTEVVEGIGG